jgi:two-component system phosphate regulon response regulator PhoB
MRPHVLAVDDEPDLLELVRMGLDAAGYQVETAATGAAALERLRSSPPDLVLLDLLLPDISGTELCKRIRADARLAELPVIMLTAKGEEVDRVVGFELGADDYVTKPFSPRELALRVRAVLSRRRLERPAGGLLRRDPLRVDPERHRCWVKEQEVVLTAKEFQLLVSLMRRPGRVYTRDQLLDDVWGSDITVTSRTIDTHLKRLREKLGEAGALIETVRGVGYRFAEG